MRTLLACDEVLHTPVRELHQHPAAQGRDTVQRAFRPFELDFANCSEEEPTPPPPPPQKKKERETQP